MFGSLRWCRVVVGATIVLAVASPSFAQPRTNTDPIVVVESRVGAMPDATDKLASTLYAEFEAEGFVARPASVAVVLGNRAPRPGLADPRPVVIAALRQVEQGYLEWSQGRFSDAEANLLEGFATLRRNPALLATDTKNADLVFRGMVALSLSQRKLGERANDHDKLAKSHDSMLDLRRAFSTRPLPREEYAPDAIDYYRKISKEADAQGHGQLFVNVDNEHVMVFVDGQMHGVGVAELSNVLPGTHHVFLQEPSRSDPGRRFDIDVHAGEDARLKVKWEVDSAFWATDAWIGFSFATEAERAQQLTYAAELASWTGRGLAVVFERIEVEGKPGVAGTLYDVAGRSVSQAKVALGDAPAVVLRELARYLSNGTRGVHLVIAPPRAEVPAPRDHHTEHSTLAGTLVLGAGALAVIGGGVLFATATSSVPFTSPDYHDPKARSVEIVAGGCAVLGAGFGLWLHQAKSVDVLPAELVGLGAGAVLAGAFLLATDEDDTVDSPPVYRDTATLGVVVGASGLATAGAGWLLWHRDSRTSGLPIVSVRREGAFVGWTGGF